MFVIKDILPLLLLTQVTFAQPSTSLKKAKENQLRLESSFSTLDSITERNWKAAYFYNENGQNEEGIIYIRQDYLNPWITHSKYEMDYDTQVGKMTHQRMYNWVADEQAWGVLDKQLSYEYNSIGDVIFESYEVRDPARNVLDTLGKVLYTFDSANRLLKSHTYSITPFTNRWELPPVPTDYSYNSFGKVQEVIRSSSWDPNTSTWLFKDRYQYEYNDFQDESAMITSSWNNTEGKWDMRLKTEYFYDNSRNKRMDMNYTTSYLSPEWKKASKALYEYDANGNLTHSQSYGWDSDTGVWTLEKNWDKVYTYNYVLSPEIALPPDFPVHKNRLLQIVVDGVAYQNYYYSDHLLTDLSTAPALTEDMSVYPNPSSQFIEVPYLPLSNTCTLYDVSGKQYPCTKTSPEHLELSHLKTGTYTLQLTLTSTTKTFHIVKE